MVTEPSEKPMKHAADSTGTQGKARPVVRTPWDMDPRGGARLGLDVLGPGSPQHETGSATEGYSLIALHITSQDAAVS